MRERAQEMEVKPSFPSQQPSALIMALCFTVDTSTGTLCMTSSVTSLVDYLKHLHLFGETFELHTKITVDTVMNLVGTTAVTQGPQGTVSSGVVVEDETTILKVSV